MNVEITLTVNVTGSGKFTDPPPFTLESNTMCEHAKHTVRGKLGDYLLWNELGLDIFVIDVSNARRIP